MVEGLTLFEAMDRVLLNEQIIEHRAIIRGERPGAGPSRSWDRQQMLVLGILEDNLPDRHIRRRFNNRNAE